MFPNSQITGSGQQFDINTIARSTGFRAKSRGDSFGDLQRQQQLMGQHPMYTNSNSKPSMAAQSSMSFRPNSYQKPRQSISGLYTEQLKPLSSYDTPNRYKMSSSPSRRLTTTIDQYDNKPSQLAQKHFPYQPSKYEAPSYTRQSLNQYSGAGVSKPYEPQKSYTQFPSSSYKQNYYPSPLQSKHVALPLPQKITVGLN